MNYRDAIDTLHRLGEDPRGHCAEWTAAIAMHYPELTRVRGWVTLRSGLRTPHWWLTTATGEIVDPTACQFDTEYFWHAGIAYYEPFNESDPEATGKCPNCAELIYDGNFCCSRKCEDEFAADCNKQRIHA